MLASRSFTALSSRIVGPSILNFSAAASASSSTTEEANSSDLVLVSRDASDIVTVTLNNPKKHNSLNWEMFNAIADTAETLSNDSTVRAVILHGNGKSFCSGLDVPSMAKNPMTAAKLLDRPHKTPKSNLAQDVGYMWRQCPFPVIAAIHGRCYGGGLQIAMGADFRYSTPDCEYSIMEAKWGIIPDMSGTVTLRDVGRLDWIKELAMTARVIKGDEAVKVGFVSRVVEEPMVEAQKVAEELASRSPDAVALTKKLFQETWIDMNEKEALEMETNLQKKLIPSWNQLAASAKNFKVNVPYTKRSV
ncbi:hypothetical protein TrRE_jg6724 [Triparma retinervis]|uniref:Uncharacterized protein n=1 Tax=Triparma retinervis TaxID=2557542 RepID=A0A9W6ZSA1_9STRA|nr:hypothetical protein TrRE_jg6724 [Triparma retinervis]